MKCTNKLSLMSLTLLLCSTCLWGCGENENISYDVYETSYQYGLTHYTAQSASDMFSDNLCVWDDTNVGIDQVDSQVAKSAGVFNTGTNETLYAQDIHKKMYPASTTKVLTAYVALKYGDLDQKITVSENAVNQASDSSVCHLQAGDVLTLRQLLYGLLMRSGNDAAIAIAEGISGDVETFVKLMNQEALLLGATNSHFVTPSGLHDENHYTTVYDMYLIFLGATSNDTFVDMISTVSYDAYYTGVDGSSKNQQWYTTNQYLLNNEDAPSNVTVIGGKTGTTGQADYCLVLLSRDAQNEPIISVIMGADCRSNLYYLMNQLLFQFVP